METIELFINPSTIIAGGDLKGHVKIHTLTEIRAKRLILLFSGKEKTSFKKQSRSGKYCKEYIGKLKTCRIEVPLYQWENPLLPPGAYQYSFILETPLDLSGSFNLSCSKAKGSIEYFLKAKLQDIHMFDLIKTKISVLVIQALPQLNSLMTEFETPLMNCSCIYRGFCLTTIELSCACFNTRESFKVKVVVDNSQARVNISNLECILWMVCRMISDEDQIHFFRKCVFLYQHNRSILHKDSVIHPKEILLDVPLKHPKINLENCPVTLGRILQCTYSLQISLEYGNVIHEEPDIQMPIYVSLQEMQDDESEDSQAIRIPRSLYE